MASTEFSHGFQVPATYGFPVKTRATSIRNTYFVLSMDTVVPQWDLPGINLPTYLPPVRSLATLPFGVRSRLVVPSRSRILVLARYSRQTYSFSPNHASWSDN